jgi:hypothetical protein
MWVSMMGEPVARNGLPSIIVDTGVVFQAVRQASPDSKLRPTRHPATDQYNPARVAAARMAKTGARA